ncbi:MAG TPA: hypothetical protein VE869_03655 [Gemmatimonas sp.]|nr:hypothetical protein [Gemmatimonas sp.]
MPTVDPVQVWTEHTVAIVNADAECRTLAGRTAGLIIPFESFRVDGPVPVIVYNEVSFVPRASSSLRLRVQFSVFGATKAVCNTLCARLADLLRYPAYAARGADIARDPSSVPVRRWPSAEPRMDDAAQYRADVDLTFLLAG